MDKQETINKVVSVFTKKFGETSASTLTRAFSPEKVRGFVPTGNLCVDWVIGRPGFPLGRITEIAGPYGSGKSSLCASSIGSAQKNGIICVLFDTEHSYESSWARIWGVNPEELILITPEHIQGLFDQVKFVVNTIKETQPSSPIYIIVDSISASPTAQELEAEDSTAGKQRGQHAVAIGEGLRKISNEIWNQNTALIFVSQLKDNPGMMYGANKHKLGGHAIEFHAGLLIEVRRSSFLKDKDDTVYGQRIEVRTIKNKFVEPFRSRTYDLYFNEGIRTKEIMLDFMSDPTLLNTIKKSGGWYEYEGSKYRKEDLAGLLDDKALGKIYFDLGITKSVVETKDDIVVPQQVLEIKDSETKVVDSPITSFVTMVDMSELK